MTDHTTAADEPPLTTTEPVISTATVTSAVTAVIALLVAFGLPLTDAQQVAILGVTAVVAPLVVIYARRWTVPSAQVVERTERQADGPDLVIAGEASELPTGTTIREAGSLDYRPTHRADALTDADVRATHAPVEEA